MEPYDTPTLGALRFTSQVWPSQREGGTTLWGSSLPAAPHLMLHPLPYLCFVPAAWHILLRSFCAPLKGKCSLVNPPCTTNCKQFITNRWMLVSLTTMKFSSSPTEMNPLPQSNIRVSANTLLTPALSHTWVQVRKCAYPTSEFGTLWPLLPQGLKGIRGYSWKLNSVQVHV